MPDFAVILPAAGRSTRFGGATNKLLTPLGGQSILGRSLSAFLNRPDVRHVIVPTTFTRDELSRACPMMASALNDARVKLCAGGASRAESVQAGLAEIPATAEWVAIHDAARPLVTGALIDRVLEAAVRCGAAAPAVAVTSTIKEAGESLPSEIVRTVPRRSLWALQTPQIMRTSLLRKAMQACESPLSQITDDLQFLELAGEPAWLVAGDDFNIKITTALDLSLAEILVK